MSTIGETPGDSVDYGFRSLLLVLLVMSIALLLLSAFSPKLPLAITTMVQAQMVKYDAMTFPNGDEQIPHPSMVQTT